MQEGNRKLTNHQRARPKFINIPAKCSPIRRWRFRRFQISSMQNACYIRTQWRPNLSEDLCGLVVKSRSAYSEGLRCNSSLGYKSCSVFHVCNKAKKKHLSQFWEISRRESKVLYPTSYFQHALVHPCISRQYMIHTFTTNETPRRRYSCKYQAWSRMRWNCQVSTVILSKQLSYADLSDMDALPLYLFRVTHII